ncbi:WD repeat-containing protein 91-like isoform X4 [Penaeus monodon]|uniref:WD repeat-containing protein 91-like isoform X4 n=1 Tax=Penaeus monodon TaxID=6687 RepID=UPI0018A7E024|nr:WD repeat-containing protein 91-like isoform X4 [Penaeus monodon]
MSHVQYLDELVKEYLLFRGFSQTLRSLDNELKIDKDKGFRVDRLVDQVVSHIQTYDLVGLRELWAHLDKRIFAHLPHTLLPCVRKLETSILRLYVVNTIQTNKSDKLVEFFEKMAQELQSQAEWREWFILPYLKGVEENSSFAMYFTRQWQDTLLVSLHNFFAVVFQPSFLQSIELPTLASYRDEASKIARLQEDNELLRARLSALTTSDQPSLEHLVVPDPPPPSHLMDDFYNIAQEAPSSESQLKSLKTILFGLGGGLPTSPILGRRATGGAASASPQPSPIAAQAPSSNNHEEYSEHRAVVTHAVFNPSGTLVASADTDGVVKLWSPSPSPKTQSGVVVKSAVTALEWLPRGERFLLLATKAASLRLYDSRDKKTVWETGPDSCPVLKDQRIMGVRVSPGEGSAVISVAPRVRPQGTSTPPAPPSLHTIDMKSLKIESSYRLDGGVVNGCIMNHNGGLLVCGCNDGSVRIIDLRCPDVIASWPAHQGEVFTVRLSPQENNIYTIGSDNRFACWSMAQTGARVMDHVLHDRAAGPFLVGVGSGGTGRSVLLRPYGPLFALHQDGEHVLTCSPTGPIVYKVGENGLEQVLQVGGHKSPVVTVDWCNALQCGTSVAAALDGSVTVATLMRQ